jgi:Fe-S cluster assembly ATP-binding protein
MKNILEISNLHVSVDNEEILKGVNLTVKSGEKHIIMGPNGSGKSTLCYAFMGHPKCTVTKGSIKFNGQNILDLPTDKRAKLGLFLAFQYPEEVPGVTFGNFVRTAYNCINKKPVGPMSFYPVVREALDNIRMDKKFIGRSLNTGFSGGEKKRAEIVQMSILKPKIAFLDEADSGLDIDALKVAASSIEKMKDTGIVLITHYQRILNYLKSDFVHLFAGGRIVKSGGFSLAEELENKGYEETLTQV